MRHLIWLVALVAACTDEASITPGVCGNYVLDPGEDCDRPGGACTSECRIACDPTQRATSCTSADAIDGTCCPTGMICGVDTVCHAPTGTVQPTEIVEPFDVTSLTLADIDGDLISDAIGTSSSSIDVLYGSQTAPLATLLSAPAPAQTAATTGFGDFDGDGRLDVVLPTVAGLFAFTTASGAPKPVSFPAVTQAGIRHERIAAGSVGTFSGAVVELDFVAAPAAGAAPLQLAVYDTPSFLSPSFKPSDGEAAPCGFSTGNSTTVHGHALHPFVDNKSVRVPVFLGRAAASICITLADPAHAPGNGTTTIGSYPVPTSVFGTYKSSPAGEMFFANLLSAAGSCPDFVFSANDPTDKPVSLILHGKGVVSSDDCSLDTTTPVVAIPGHPLAEIDIVGLLGGTSPALITTAGVFTNFTNPMAPAIAPTRPWTYAVVGDLDGDGRQDFVTMGQGTDVEVFRQVPGIGANFVDLLIPTVNPVIDLALGNFDGDKAGDIAIATSDVDTGIGELSIAWGSVDTTFTLADVGAFPELTSIASTDLLDVSLPSGLDHQNDVLVARGGANPTDPNDPALLIAEYGATSRALGAPFVDQSTFGGSSPIHGAGLQVQIGAFGTNGAPGLIAMFTPSPVGISAIGGAPPKNLSVLDLTYESFGSFSQSPDAVSDWPCTTDPMLDTPFCPAKATFSHIHNPGADELIALRQDVENPPRSECALYYSAAAGASGLTTLGCSDLAPSAATSSDPGVQAAYTALTGVDRTGVIYAMDSSGMHLEIDTDKKHAEQSFVWQLTLGASGQPQLANPIAIDTELNAAGLLPAGATATCMDVNEVELGRKVIDGVSYGAGTTELMIACTVDNANVFSTGIYARYTNPSGGSPYYERIVDLGIDQQIRLRVGDVNGDGLQDIGYTLGSSTTGRQELHVLLQCDGHAVGCLGGR